MHLLAVLEDTVPNNPRVMQAVDQAVFDYDFKECSMMFGVTFVPNGRIPKDLSHQGIYVKYLLGVTDKCLLVMNPDTGKIHRALSWAYFCRFESKECRGLQIVCFTRFMSNSVSVEDRLRAGTPIQKSECEGWFLYVDGSDETMQRMRQHLAELSVPERFWGMPPQLS